jgi:hypothetical protein
VLGGCWESGRSGVRGRSVVFDGFAALLVKYRDCAQGRSIFSQPRSTKSYVRFLHRLQESDLYMRRVENV